MTTVSEIFETMAYGPAPESDKPALEWIARQSGAFGLFIGGRWAQRKNDPGVDGFNPPPTARPARRPPARPAGRGRAVPAARDGVPPSAARSRRAPPAPAD